MQITVKLFSSLIEYLPESTRNDLIVIEVDDTASADTILRKYNIPLDEVNTMMLNGVFLPEDERSSPLEDGDVVTIWPVIQGG